MSRKLQTRYGSDRGHEMLTIIDAYMNPMLQPSVDTFIIKYQQRIMERGYV